MDKVVYVKAYFRPIGKEITVNVPTGETKKGMFGGEKQITRKEKQWKSTGWSDCEIDGERLTEDLQRTIEALNKEGYSIKSITSILSGAYNYQYQAEGITSSPRFLSDTEAVKGGASYGYGYGYSYTESLIVHAAKNV
ncbi:hypothetical protein [Amphritea sp.]|uniref:hypothetical protein n=1 Tax=Amphritea sp. TaxID=1872502 RepID=UPI003D142102